MPDAPLIPQQLRQPRESKRLLDLVRLKVRRQRFQQAVRTRRFSVIAVNCWGAEIYRDLEIPYQTPFVNLYMQLPCFVGMLENFAEAMRAPLEFVDESRSLGPCPFPIGQILGQFEIHFMHFKSHEEAREKWYRRRERMVTDLDDCYFMLKHLGEPYAEELRRFDQLLFRNKVLFVESPMPEMPNAVVVPRTPGVAEPDDGLTLYYRCQRYFDIPAWLNKEPQPPRLAKPMMSSV